MTPMSVVSVSPVSVMSVSPVSVMSVVSVSGPVLSVRSPLVFGPEDVVGPVSLRMSVMKPPTLAVVDFVVVVFVVVVVIVVVMSAVWMKDVMGVVSNDEDHLQAYQERAGIYLCNSLHC